MDVDVPQHTTLSPPPVSALPSSAPPSTRASDPPTSIHATTDTDTNMQVDDVPTQPPPPPPTTTTASTTTTLPAFPQSRVRTIMRFDPDVMHLGTDAVLAVTHATEHFLALLAQRSYGCTVQDGRKILGCRDVARAVAEGDELLFLEDIVPVVPEVKKVVKKKAVGVKPTSTVDGGISTTTTTTTTVVVVDKGNGPAVDDDHAVDHVPTPVMAS
ncbi:DNA polymerase epsilon subunit 4 [Thoreauomyces humboldtii]|nr:DNA polymerase epsilon subunit 4 [Thoreauomyces humboldtii]